MMSAEKTSAGPVLLFGSGETAPSARRLWARVMSNRARVAILETPAGFQPNSSQVAHQIADFLRVRFGDRHLQVSVIPARNRAQANDPTVVAPLARADLTFLGPGSPTYTVRHLRGTLAWRLVRYRWQRQGMALVLASAAVLAVSRFTLPVYEIFKVGEPLHWRPGLRLLPWVLVPHWDNREGGADLDTRYCFMGAVRFRRLCALLPPEVPLVGIAEHTALLWQPSESQAEVLGKGEVVWHPTPGAAPQHWAAGMRVPLAARLPRPRLAPEWRSWLTTQQKAPSPPPEVQRLTAMREAARRQRDWSRADALRERIRQAGWQVRDTPQGPELLPLDPQ